MSISLLAATVLLAMHLGACAHRDTRYQEPRADRSVADPLRAGPQRPARPAEQDPRYRLPPAQKRSVTIFLDSQTFEYVEDGRVVASGPVSSGSAEHPTPTGAFRILSKDANKRSGSYTNYFNQPTPMPYSLRFSGPYFIHEGWLPGYADSHGCVRLRYEDARLLFHRVRVGDPVLVRRDGEARSINPWPALPLVF